MNDVTVICITIIAILPDLLSGPNGPQYMLRVALNSISIARCFECCQ